MKRARILLHMDIYAHMHTWISNRYDLRLTSISVWRSTAEP